MIRGRRDFDRIKEETGAKVEQKGRETSTRVRTVALHAALLYEEGGADGHSHDDKGTHDNWRLGIALGHCC